MNTSSVGRFGKWRSPSAVVKSAAHQVCGRQQPDRQLGAGPAQLDRVEAALGRAASPSRSASPCAPPTRPPGSGSSSRSTCSSSLPEPLVRLVLGELRVDELRPRGCGHGTIAPVGRSARRSTLRRLLQPRAAGPCRRAPCRGRRAAFGSVAPGERDARALRSPRARACRSPYHCGTYSSVSGSACCDPRALQVRVEVDDVDELSRRAGRRPRRPRAPAPPARARPRRPRSGPAARSRRAPRARRVVSTGRPSAGDPYRGAEAGWRDLRGSSRALPGRGGHLATRRGAPTRRTCASSPRWFGARQPARGRRRPRARRLGRRARPRARPHGKLAPATISRKLVAVRALLRYSLGPERVPDASLAPKRAAPAARRAQARRDRGRSSTRCDGDEPLPLRNRALVELVYSAGLRSAEAVGLDLGDVDFEQELVHVRKRQGLEGPRRAARRGGGAPRRPLPARRAARARRAAPRTRSSSRRAAAASTPRRCAASSRTRTACATRSRRTCSRAAPTCARSRSCSATPRSRRRRCTATSTPSASAASTTTRTRARRRRRRRGTGWRTHAAMERDPDVEGFLALLAARRAPRTVEAYRRDLTALRAFLGKPVSTRDARASSSATRRSCAPTASRRATIARRTAAARSFFRHQQLLGAREDNPAAARRSCRAARARCRGRSRPGEAERLIEAAAGTQPRALRDQALVELLYGAGLRVSRGGRPRQGGRRPRRPARPRASARATRSASSRSAGTPPRPCAATSRAAGRTSTAATAPELFLNARGGAAHPRRRVPDPAQARREGRARPGPRPPAPAPPLVRHPPARGRRRPPLACRRCSATPTSRRPSSTPTYPIGGAGSCISRRTPMRDERRTEERGDDGSARES